MASRRRPHARWFSRATRIAFDDALAELPRRKAPPRVGGVDHAFIAVLRSISSQAYRRTTAN